MAGQAVTFRITQATSHGSYSLNGQTFPLTIVLTVGRGSFVLDMRTASFLAPFDGTPILLHAPHFDTTLRAEQLLERSRLPVFGSVSLVDENGEVLTDENGNALTATVDNVVSFILHALPDDWNLTANQVSE